MGRAAVLHVTPSALAASVRALIGAWLRAFTQIKIVANFMIGPMGWGGGVGFPRARPFGFSFGGALLDGLSLLALALGLRVRGGGALI